MFVLAGCMGPRPHATTPRPKVVSRAPEPSSSPPLALESSSSLTAPVIAAGEPVVGFDGQRLETAFYAPVSLAVKNDRFDLIIHFHGKHQTAIDALDQSGLPAALISVDLGVGSRIYRGAYDEAGSLERLIAFAERSLHETGRLPNARVRRIALSAWSAGYGAARLILSRPAEEVRVDALLLVDALFADWDAKGGARTRTASMDALAPILAFGERATRAEKLLVVTHTAITQSAYAGAPECADALLRHFDILKGPAPLNARPFGGAPMYSADLEDLHLRGFDGKTTADHAEQYRAMGTLHYLELRRYWEREASGTVRRRGP
jgi:hypothetical protein